MTLFISILPSYILADAAAAEIPKPYFDKHINQLIRNLEDKTDGTLVKANNLSILRDTVRSSDKRFLVIPFITDTHYDSSSVDQAASSDGLSTAASDDLRSWSHMENVAAFSERFNVDAVIHGGDIIDGKMARSNSVENLRTAMNIFKKSNVPALFAKGNHDDNSIYDLKYGDAAGDMKDAIKGNVLDPIFREGANSRIQFDTSYLNSTRTFNPKFKNFMDPEEYRVSEKLFLGDPSTGSKNMSDANILVLTSMLKSITMTSTQSSAWTEFKAFASSTRNLTHLGEVNASYKTALTQAIYSAAVARTTGSYGYIDFPEKNIRLIVLNSYDVPYELDSNGKSTFPLTDFGAYSKAQVEWFANTALQTTKEVVVFSHVALTGSPFTRDGGPRTYKQTDSGDDYWIGNTELMKAILDDFINGKDVYHTSKSAIKKYSQIDSTVNPNAISLIEGETPSPTNSPWYFYYNSRLKYKAKITDHERVSTSITTNFEHQGPGTVITSISGHSHVARMGLDVTGSYTAAMSNSSLRDGKEFPLSTGLERNPSTYREDASEVIVIDTIEKMVYFYPFGAGMINENLVTADTTEFIETDPIKIKAKLVTDVLFPVRYLGYAGKQSKSNSYNGLQGGVSEKEGN